MDISFPSAAGSIDAVAAASQQHHRKSPFDAVSSLLGMSADDIRAAVKNGTSLDNLAKSKGVSHADLVAALKAGAPPRAQQDPNFDANIEKLTQATGNLRGWGGHLHHDGGAAASSASTAQQSGLSVVSSLLGTSPDDLLAELNSGTSLSSLLDAKGISVDQLGSALQSGMLVDTNL